MEHALRRDGGSIMRVRFDKAALLVAVAALFLALGAGNAAGVCPRLPGGPVHSGGVASALARFNPVSASFVSGRAGFVLGARGCAKPPCPARLVKTADGGRIWAASPAPPVPVVGEHAVSPPRAVSTVRFASRQDGWLFGPGLWATHDAAGIGAGFSCTARWARWPPRRGWRSPRRRRWRRPGPAVSEPGGHQPLDPGARCGAGRCADTVWSLGLGGFPTPPVGDRRPQALAHAVVPLPGSLHRLEQPGGGHGDPYCYLVRWQRRRLQHGKLVFRLG